jgi:outer membrane protein assembly factor BamE
LLEVPKFLIVDIMGSYSYHFLPMLKKTVLILFPLMMLAGCSTLDKLKPYKMDIQQGTVVTQEMIYKLKPGMTKSQVRFVMGSPSIADPFHQDRWDYIYRLNKGGKLVEERKIALFFENDLLKSVKGDVVAATSEDYKEAEEKREGKLKPAEPAKESAPGKADEKSDSKADSNEDAPEDEGFFSRMLKKIGL